MKYCERPSFTLEYVDFYTYMKQQQDNKKKIRMDMHHLHINSSMVFTLVKNNYMYQNKIYLISNF